MDAFLEFWLNRSTWYCLRTSDVFGKVWGGGGNSLSNSWLLSASVVVIFLFAVWLLEGGVMSWCLSLWEGGVGRGEGNLCEGHLVSM